MITLPTDDIKELIETAREHFRQSNYKIAESILNQLVQQEEKTAEVFHMLATIYYDQGKFNKAIKTFRRALEIDPAFTDASVGLSIILNDIGRYDEAKKVFNEAQNILDRQRQQDPETQERLAQKHDELGELYFQTGNFDKALEHFQQAYRFSERKTDFRMKIIECWIQSHDTYRAQKELKALINENPQFTAARLRLGLLLFEHQHIPEAVEQ